MIDPASIIVALIAVLGLLTMAVGIGQVLRESQRESRCACCHATYCDYCTGDLCRDCGKCKVVCCRCGGPDAFTKRKLELERIQHVGSQQEA